MGDKDNPPQKHKGGHKDANNFSISTDLYHSADPRICISVSDNGSGIPPEKLAELNRSIRDFKTARHSFGLPSINHRIALLYGENYGLTIESSPEKGTTVTIVIPDKNLIEGEI